MRKIFASLKAVVAAALVASMTLAASCSYDDSAINNRVNKVEEAIKALEDRVKALEDHASAVDKLIDELVVVTDVTVDGDKTTVTLSDGTSFVVYGECDTLQYRVNDGVLEVSADGQNWVAVEQTADCVITDVVVNDDNTVTFTLADGTEFTVALAELIECEATRTGVYVLPGATKEIVFTVNDAVVDMNIMNQPFGWSATVGEPTVEEENGGFAPFAAGGTDYALKITGPSEELVGAGYAAKEGVVSVHFNTASGACKVLSVNVSLAEISLSIDENGVITLSNSIVETVNNQFWGPMTGFANFYIGFLPKADYEAYLEGMELDFESMSFTQRDSGFGSAVELVEYIEGECESESYTFTLDEFKQSIWYGDPLPSGVEYVVFATVEYDGDFNPVLASAATVEFVKPYVLAELVEGSEKWNDVTYNFSLLGYDNYLIGWVPSAEVDMMMTQMELASVEEFLAMYIQGNSLMGSGTIIPQDLADEDINLSELAGISAFGFAPEILPGTEYYFYVYAFNGGLSEMEIYTHPFNPANLHLFGEFTSSSLVAGEFDPGAEFEVIEMTEDYISVEVTFSEDVDFVAYSWNEEGYLDPAQAVEGIFADFYAQKVTFDEETHSIIASKSDYYGITYPYYLTIIAVDAAGQYVYVEQAFSPEDEGGEGGEGNEGDEGDEEPAEVTVVSLTATLGGTTTGDQNFYSLAYNLSNGDVVAADFRTNGNNYLTVGSYTDSYGSWTNGEAEGHIGYVYKNGTAVSFLSASVSYADGAYTVNLSIYDYNKGAAEDYTYTGAIEGLDAPVIEEGSEGGEGGEGDEGDEGNEGGDDTDWADAITLTNISMYKKVANVLDWSTNFCYFYTLSDESGDNAVTIFATDYFFSTSWLEATTYQYVDPYFANTANDGDYKFSAYEVKVNGVNVELSYESSATGTLVITNPDTDTYTFKCAVPGADGNTYKFTTGNLKLVY